MWRFAAYTQKTSFLSKTCLKTVRQALKHTDGRTDYFRFLSNDASQIRMDKDRPIREVFSFDDFGLLSSNNSRSTESMSSAGSDHTFLEQLLRNDALNAFSNVQIPTTVSAKELEGSQDVFGYDYVSELLAEGAIPEEIAEELEENFAEPPASYLDDQKPSTSGLEVTELPFLIPNLDNGNNVMSETIRRERKLNLSTTTPIEEDTPLFRIPETNVMDNVGEMLFPESLPLESYTSLWKEGDAPKVAQTTSQPTVHIDQHPPDFSLEVLEGIMTEGTWQELKKELESVESWPEYLFTGEKRLLARTSRLLRYIVENSADYAEAEKIISKFASSNMLAIIPDDVLLQLTSKSITEATTVAQIVKKLEDVSKICLSRELRPNRQLIEPQLAVLYQKTIQKCAKTSPSLLTLCSRLNFDRSADIFMKSYGAQQAASGTFLKSFDGWKKLSTKFGSQHGVDEYWLEALRTEEGCAKRVDVLLQHSCQHEHPFATMARMICAFVRLGHVEKALEVFRTVSVSGRHFREPLAGFVEKNDLQSIERLAILVERGMIAERRRGGGKRANKTDTQPEKVIGEEVHAVLAKFYGVGGQKQKKFEDKKLKKKIHRVDEEQLHELCGALQKAWVQCADGKEATGRLVEWCQKNRVEIDEKVQKRIQ